MAAATTLNYPPASKTWLQSWTPEEAGFWDKIVRSTHSANCTSPLASATRFTGTCGGPIVWLSEVDAAALPGRPARGSLASSKAVTRPLPAE